MIGRSGIDDEQGNISSNPALAKSPVQFKRSALRFNVTEYNYLWELFSRFSIPSCWVSAQTISKALPTACRASSTSSGSLLITSTFSVAMFFYIPN